MANYFTLHLLIAFLFFPTVPFSSFDSLRFSYVVAPDLQRYKSGNPPASRQFIEDLPSLQVSHSDELETCVTCLEDLKEGHTATVLPCGHRFHRKCLKPWLELHNTCPICRYEVATDDKKYLRYREHRKRIEEEVRCHTTPILCSSLHTLIDLEGEEANRERHSPRG